MKRLAIIVLLFSSLSCLAVIEKQQLVHIKTSFDNLTAKIFVEVDTELDNEIIRFGYAQFMKDKKTGEVKLIEEDPNNPGYTEVYSSADLAGDGVVICARRGRKVVKLRSDHVDGVSGGVLVIDFLKNAIRNRRGSLELSLLKNESGSWELTQETQDNILPQTKVGSLELVGSKVFGKLIGISKIKVIN